MSSTRKYELKKRAETQAGTRRRITEAIAELHATIGPARTTVTAVAERAGVQRLTVYRHFPTERDMFAACSAHWLSQSPPPDPAGFAGIADPSQRTRRLLEALYGWYRSERGMLFNTERDAALLPELAAIADPRPFLDGLKALLLVGREARGARARRMTAALGHALAFSTWRSLDMEGLSDAEAAALMAGLVDAAGAPARISPRRGP